MHEERGLAVFGLRELGLGAGPRNLRERPAEHLIGSGIIAGGMVPKVRAALGALGWEGAEAIIADASAPNALTRALSDESFGTRITSSRAAGVGAA